MGCTRSLRRRGPRSHVLEQRRCRQGKGQGRGIATWQRHLVEEARSRRDLFDGGAFEGNGEFVKATGREHVDKGVKPAMLALIKKSWDERQALQYPVISGTYGLLTVTHCTKVLSRSTLTHPSTLFPRIGPRRAWRRGQIN